MGWGRGRGCRVVPGLMGVVPHCSALFSRRREGGHNASVITIWANQTYGVLLQLY